MLKPFVVTLAAVLLGAVITFAFSVSGPPF